MKPHDIFCRLPGFRVSGCDRRQSAEKSGVAAPLMWALSALDCAIEQPGQQGQPFGCVLCQHGAGVADQALSVHRHAPYRVEVASACLAAQG
ncbi:hypothetical protein KUT97_09730 [Pseudomonas aeruginosa]|nr:hypothetical protein [Pseudomonas aeruginosa]HBP1729220.1 hypothetical protein [Pseudomonas aeruginosa]HCF2599568.1 hypothetical protein [Pseudomonas aeruginosa]HEJ9826937.1 hypothetical protein [Pseudomonas aeruginosa]